MVFAVVLVYLLMAVNFQSWLDPFIILTALPGAMAGILWMLFVTGTTLSVPSLMGAIMCIGVATANSILMVTFANDERAQFPPRARPCFRPVCPHPAGADDGHGDDSGHAAHGAGFRRRRRAERAAGPRGDRRAVFATVTTLFVVPIIYTYLRTKPPVDHERRLEELEERPMSISNLISPDLVDLLEQGRLRENQDLKRQLEELKAAR